MRCNNRDDLLQQISIFSEAQLNIYDGAVIAKILSR